MARRRLAARALDLPGDGPPAGIAVIDGDHLVLVFTRGPARDRAGHRRRLPVDPAIRSRAPARLLAVVDSALLRGAAPLARAPASASPASASPARRRPSPLAQPPPAAEPPAWTPIAAADSTARAHAPASATRPSLGDGSWPRRWSWRGAGAPLAHVAFLWQFPLRPRLSLWARALWPMLARSSRPTAR
jgi:hypothetical protein